MQVWCVPIGPLFQALSVAPGGLMMDSRPEWGEYFLAVAKTVALRADCSRRLVGAVIVKDNRIVSTGYNGAPAGKPGCLSAGACPRGSSDVAPGSSYDSGPGTCIAIHAEQNAIIYADYDKCVGSGLYLTDAHCDGCRRLIAGAGICWVRWPEGYYKV